MNTQNTFPLTGVQWFDTAVAEASLKEQFKEGLNIALKLGSPLQDFLTEAKYSQDLRSEVTARYRDANKNQRREVDLWMQSFDPMPVEFAEIRRAYVLTERSTVTEYLDDLSVMALHHTNYLVREQLGSRSRIQGLEIAKDASAIQGLSPDERIPAFNRLLSETSELSSGMAKVAPLTKLAQALEDLPETDFESHFSKLLEVVKTLTHKDRSEPVKALIAVLMPPSSERFVLQTDTDEGRKINKIRIMIEYGPTPEVTEPMLVELWNICFSMPAQKRGDALTALLRVVQQNFSFGNTFLITRVQEVAQSGNAQRQVDTLLALQSHARALSAPPSLLRSMDRYSEFMQSLNANLDDMLILFGQLVQHDVGLATEVIPTFIQVMGLRNHDELNRLIAFIQPLPLEVATPSLKAMLGMTMLYGDPAMRETLYGTMVDYCLTLNGEQKFAFRLALTIALCRRNLRFLQTPFGREHFALAYTAAIEEHSSAEQKQLLVHLAFCAGTNAPGKMDAITRLKTSEMTALGWTRDMLKVAAGDPTNLLWALSEIREAPPLARLEVLTVAIDTFRLSARVDLLGPIISGIQALPRTEQAVALKKLQLAFFVDLDWKKYGKALAALYAGSTSIDTVMQFVHCFSRVRKLTDGLMTDEVRTEVWLAFSDVLKMAPTDVQARTLPYLVHVTMTLENPQGEDLHKSLVEEEATLKQHPLQSPQFPKPFRIVGGRTC